MRITSESSRIFPLHSYTAALRATWDLIDASSTHPRLHKIWVSTGGVHGSPHHSPPTAHRQSSRRRAQHSSGDAAHASGEATTHRDYTHRNPVKTPPMCVTGGATTHRLPTEIHSRDAAHVSQVEPPPTDSPQNNTAKMPPMCHSGGASGNSSTSTASALRCPWFERVAHPRPVVHLMNEAARRVAREVGADILDQVV